MINRLLNMLCWPVLVTAFVVAGCERGYKEDALAYGPDIETIVVTNDYTPRAIRAAGGYQAWTKTKKLEFDCVVTFYKPDGSLYLTEHHYEVYPWSNSIRISADEPQGKFVCQLSADTLSVLEGPERADALPITIDNRCFAESILDITTAPVRLLESKARFTKGPEPVKIEGLWYYPIERATPAGDKQGDVESYWSKVVFYQNRDSSLVDMIWLAGKNGKSAVGGLAVRGYDYHEIEKGGVRVPAKIEIFKTDVRGVLQERLVKIDLK